MSIVTNIIICCSLLENDEDLICQFEKYMHNGHSFGIQSVESRKLPKGWYGGEKHLECIILIGAYNHLKLVDFLDFMRTLIHWEAPDLVQVFVKGEDDMKFKIIELVE